MCILAVMNVGAASSVMNIVFYLQAGIQVRSNDSRPS